MFASIHARTLTLTHSTARSHLAQLRPSPSSSNHQTRQSGSSIRRHHQQQVRTSIRAAAPRASICIIVDPSCLAFGLSEPHGPTQPHCILTSFPSSLLHATTILSLDPTLHRPRLPSIFCFGALLGRSHALALTLSHCELSPILPCPLLAPAQYAASLDPSPIFRPSSDPLQTYRISSKPSIALLPR